MVPPQVLQSGAAFAKAGIHALDERGRGVELQLPPFPSMALNVGEWSTSRSARFTPGKQHLFPTELERRGGPQSRFGRVSRLDLRSEFELRSVELFWSLYRLRCPGPQVSSARTYTRVPHT